MALSRIRRWLRSAAVWVTMLMWGAEITAVFMLPVKVSVLANGAGIVTTAGAFGRSARERRLLIRAVDRKINQPDEELPARPGLRRVR